MSTLKLVVTITLVLEIALTAWFALSGEQRKCEACGHPRMDPHQAVWVWLISCALNVATLILIRCSTLGDEP